MSRGGISSTFRITLELGKVRITWTDELEIGLWVVPLEFKVILNSFHALFNSESRINSLVWWGEEIKTTSSWVLGSASFSKEVSGWVVDTNDCSKIHVTILRED